MLWSILMTRPGLAAGLNHSGSCSYQRAPDVERFMCVVRSTVPLIICVQSMMGLIMWNNVIILWRRLLR